MTERELRNLVVEWDLGDANESPQVASRFQALLQKLTWFGETQWSTYLPSEQAGEDPHYLSRLARWIGNVPGEKSRQLLLEYATCITFFSHADFHALHLAAFRGPITRWVVEQTKLGLADPQFQQKLSDELRALTWYCPVTDSFDINEFHHLNHLSGVQHRPAFATLAMLDTRGGVASAGQTTDELVRNLKQYIAKPSKHPRARPLKRLVLLEDFVGSGSQAADPIAWALHKLDIPVLFVPLVICCTGLEALRQLEESSQGRLKVSPLVTVRPEDVLGPVRQPQIGIPNAEEIEALATATFARISGAAASELPHAPYTPFGYRKTGCSFVSYSNTPDNTLPLIHHRPAGGTWEPLFPRASRI